MCFLSVFDWALSDHAACVNVPSAWQWRLVLRSLLHLSSRSDADWIGRRCDAIRYGALSVLCPDERTADESNGLRRTSSAKAKGGTALTRCMTVLMLMLMLLLMPPAAAAPVPASPSPLLSLSLPLSPSRCPPPSCPSSSSKCSKCACALQHSTLQSSACSCGGCARSAAPSNRHCTARQPAHLVRSRPSACRCSVTAAGSAAQDNVIGVVVADMNGLCMGCE